MKTTDLREIEKDDVHCYRANTGYVTVYMNDGSIFYVEEDFEAVDAVLNTSN